MSETQIGLFLCGVAYLVGSIPFGLVFSKIFGGVDPRSAGSGNIGFTNVLRLSGKKVGILTLLGDFGKGWVMSWVGVLWASHQGIPMLVAFSVLLGHIFPVFLKFHGGKGVATGLGAILGLQPMIGLIMVGLWLTAVGIWRYSSGGALLAFGALPILGILFEESGPFIFMCIWMSGLIFYKHLGNIQRLWKGTESRIGFSSS